VGRYLLHMAFLRAARRPTLVLNRNLHNEIGYALRKYEKSAGSRGGFVQLKTRQLLTSLHADLLCDGHQLAWKACSAQSRSGNSEVSTLLLPPGLEFEAVPAEQRQNQAYDEDILDTPRRSNAGSSLTSMDTPVKSLPPKRINSLQDITDAVGASDDTKDDTKDEQNRPVVQNNLQQNVESGSIPRLQSDSDSKDRHRMMPAPGQDSVDETASSPFLPNLQVQEHGAYQEQVQDLGIIASEQLRSERLHRVRIALDGNGISKRQHFGMIQDLVASATQVLSARGFESVQQRVKVDKLDGGIVELLFPDAVCARGFYLLFDEYHWDTSDGSHCLVVDLSNDEIKKEMSSPNLKLLFANPAAITPANILEHFPS